MYCITNEKQLLFYMISRFLFLMVAALCLASCDEGDIYPVESGNGGSDARIVHLTGTVTGSATLPSGYSLVLAGFKEGTDYTALQKTVSVSDAGQVDMTLTAQPELYDFELCITNGVRKRIVTLASVTASGPGDVALHLDTIDVSGMAIVQRAVFTPSCASCHGVASTRNANLCLADGQSRGNLVNVPSQRVGGALRVQPGNPTSSVLHQAIESNIPEIAMPHADILDAKKKGDLLDLLDAWILELDTD